MSDSVGYSGSSQFPEWSIDVSIVLTIVTKCKAPGRCHALGFDKFAFG